MKRVLLRTAFLLTLFTAMILTVLWVHPSPGWLQSPEIRLSKGQTVYVPVYSNVFPGPRIWELRPEDVVLLLGNPQQLAVASTLFDAPSAKSQSKRLSKNSV